MHIVLITDMSRPDLLRQTVDSMIANAADWSAHALLLVYDGSGAEAAPLSLQRWWEDSVRGLKITGVTTGKKVGVGGAKNFGAQWLYDDRVGYFSPDELLMFSDDDMYYLPGWDVHLEAVFEAEASHAQFPRKPGVAHFVMQLGGWRHPYHQRGAQIGQARAGDPSYYEVDAATGNCFVIRWADWLTYGPFDANALGPGQSEDFALSQKIKAAGGIVATLDPPVAIHCGLANVLGEPATGWREMLTMAQGQLRTLPRGTNIAFSMPPSIMQDPAGLAAEGGQGGPAETPTPPESDPVVMADAHQPFMPYENLPALDPWAVAERVGLANLGEPPSRIPTPTVNRLMEENLTERKPFWAGQDSLKLNIGSGQRRFDTRCGWKNIDVVSRPPDQVPDLICDARKLDLHFQPESVDMVALCHVVEHFGCGEAIDVIKQSHRVLRPGGSLVVIVPDMQALAGRWLGGEIDDYIFMVNAYGAYQTEEGDRHRWGYTLRSLSMFLYDCAPWAVLKKFDYRDVPGSAFPRDWWMLAVEVVKK